MFYACVCVHHRRDNVFYSFLFTRSRFLSLLVSSSVLVLALLSRSHSLSLSFVRLSSLRFPNVCSVFHSSCFAVSERTVRKKKKERAAVEKRWQIRGEIEANVHTDGRTHMHTKTSNIHSHTRTLTHAHTHVHMHTRKPSAARSDSQTVAGDSGIAIDFGVPIRRAAPDKERRRARETTDRSMPCTQNGDDTLMERLSSSVVIHQPRPTAACIHNVVFEPPPPLFLKIFLHTRVVRLRTLRTALWSSVHCPRYE